MASLRVMLDSRHKDEVRALCRMKRGCPAPHDLYYGSYHLVESDGEGGWYFECADIFSVLTSFYYSQPVIPDKMIFKVTIFDRLYDHSKFIPDGLYEVGNIYASAQLVNGKHGVEQQIEIVGQNVTEAIDALIALRQNKVKPKVWLEPRT